MDGITTLRNKIKDKNYNSYKELKSDKNKLHVLCQTKSEGNFIYNGNLQTISGSRQNNQYFSTKDRLNYLKPK